MKQHIVGERKYMYSEIHAYVLMVKAEMFSALIRGRSRCYASLHCEENGHMTTWNIHNAGKMLCIGIEDV